MTANELRIGNLFKYSDNAIIKPEKRGVISSIIADDISFLAHSDNDNLIEPIPLTEEWLLKFGFVDTGSGIYNFNGTLILYFKIDDEFSLMGYNSKRWQKTVVLKYVHQLQNLYFALTGEELTLKS